MIYDILFNGTPVIGTDCKALKAVAEFKAGYVYHNIEDIDLETLWTKKYMMHIVITYCCSKRHKIPYAQQIRSFVLEGKKS